MENKVSATRVESSGWLRTSSGALGQPVEVSDEERQLPTGYVLEGNVSTGNYFGIYLWNFRTTGWPEPAIVLLGGDNDFSGNACRDVWIAPRPDFATCP